ncbi:beta-1,4-glucuronyltransferase 1-like [Onthophagus taurus]|uniref:beta-1,4-glucuronyltransferase 1-like n=1 Tax=Onthophagus taurus TaxID=166361 RepID=UPI0039BDDD5C
MRGKYFVLYNYVLPSLSFNCRESVTYTTHGDFSFLENIETLVDRWDGPISLAVYAPGSDFELSLRSIKYLRNCRHSKIKKFVTFHVFFDWEHFPVKESKPPIINRYNDEINCNQKPPYSIKESSSYRFSKNLTYPINTARNIARQTSQTHFVLASDIELYPPINFSAKFLNMIANKSHINQINVKKPHVFVTPVFELAKHSKIPNNKTQLQTLLKEKLAQLFHHDICSICHRIPKLNEWIESKEEIDDEAYDVFAVGERTKKYSHWEPFYVGTRNDPPFDERLTWEGQSNKIPQAYSMCLLDYQYLVLNNAFLVHRPGIKKSKDQLTKFSKLVAKTNYLLRNVIHHELMSLYGKKKGCRLY